MRLKKFGFLGACSACTLFLCSDAEAMNFDFSSFYKEKGLNSAEKNVAEVRKSRDNAEKKLQKESVAKQKALDKVKGLDKVFTDRNKTFVEQAKKLQNDFNIAHTAGLALIAQRDNAWAERDNAKKNFQKERAAKQKILNEVKGLDKVFTDRDKTFVEQAKKLQNDFNIAHEAAGTGRLSLVAQRDGAILEKNKLSDNLKKVKSLLEEFYQDKEFVYNNEVLDVVDDLVKGYEDLADKLAETNIEKLNALRVVDGYLWKSEPIDRSSLSTMIEDFAKHRYKVIRDLNDNVQELGKRLNGANIERMELKSQLSEANQKAEDAENARKAADEARTNAENAKAELESQLSEANQKAEDAENARKAADEARTNAENARAELENQLSEANQKAEDAENARKAADEVRTNAENARAELESQLNEANQKAEDAENARKAADEARTNAENEKVELENQLSEANQKAEDAENARKAADEARTNAENARAELESQLSEANQKAVDAENERKAADEARTNAKNARAELENQLNEANQKATDAENARAELENQLSEANQKAVDAENARAELESQLNEANQKVVDAEKAKTEAENAKADLENKLNEAGQKNVSQENKLLMNVLKAVYRETEDESWLDGVITGSDGQKEALSKLLDILRESRQ